MEGVLTQIIPVRHCTESAMNVTGRPGGTASEVNQQTNGGVAKVERCMGAGGRLARETMFLGKRKHGRAKTRDVTMDAITSAWGGADDSWKETARDIEATLGAAITRLPELRTDS